MGQHTTSTDRSQGGKSFASEGAIVGGLLPGVSLAQYYASDLPKLLRSADELSKAKVYKPSKLLEASRTGDIGVQMAPSGHLRNALKAFRDNPGDRLYSFLEELQAGYGPSSVAGSPARHTFMNVGGKVFEAGKSPLAAAIAALHGGATNDEIRALVGKEADKHSLKSLLWRGGNHTDVFNSAAKKSDPQVVAMYTHANPLSAEEAAVAGKRMVANALMPYPGHEAVGSGIARLLFPHLSAGGLASKLKDRCIGGHCAVAPANALAQVGKNAPAGSLNLMPSDYMTSPALKPVGIAVRNLKGGPPAIKAFLRNEILRMAKNRTALGLGTTAAAAGAGALAGKLFHKKPE